MVQDPIWAYECLSSLSLLTFLEGHWEKKSCYIFETHQTFDSHFSDVRKVLKRSRQYWITLKPRKCDIQNLNLLPWESGTGRRKRSGFCQHHCHQILIDKTDFSRIATPLFYQTKVTAQEKHLKRPEWDRYCIKKRKKWCHLTQQLNGCTQTNKFSSNW